MSEEGEEMEVEMEEMEEGGEMEGEVAMEGQPCTHTRIPSRWVW